MISKLLNCDPKDVPPARAAAAFMAEVNRLTREQGMSLGDAWAQVKSVEPELMDRINESQQPTTAGALENGSSALQRPGLPALLANKPFVAGALHLPVTVDNDILEAAWRSNGAQTVRVDAKKVFMGVQVFLMKTKGMTAPIASRQICEDFPELAQFAGQMPQEAAGATGNLGIKP